MLLTTEENFGKVRMTEEILNLFGNIILQVSLVNVNIHQRKEEDVYEKYEKARDEKGLNNNQVAKLSGVSNVTLSGWKHGLYTPKIDKIKAIAKVLDKPLEYFLT